MDNQKLGPIHWQPRTWDEPVGNEELIDDLKTVVHGVRMLGLRQGFNTLTTGETRTGKTCLTRFAIRCLYCQELDVKSMNPCPGTCSNCRENPDSYGLYGFQNHSSVFDLPDGKTPIPFHYIAVDCSDDNLNAKQLKDEVLFHTRQINRHVLMIVYFDEVHHLAKKGLDSMLLKPLEDHAAIWFGTSAYLKREDIPGRSKTLDHMFFARFPYKCQTTLPSIKSLTEFLFHRCVEYSIYVENPIRSNLTFLSERSNQKPYNAMQVLQKAWVKPGRFLNREMIEKHKFDFE